MIHLNIGSNLDSKYGSRFENISIAINLLINLRIKIKKISNFYETPSYPNKRYPKFLNIGMIIDYDSNSLKLLKEIKITYPFSLEEQEKRIKSIEEFEKNISELKSTLSRKLLCFKSLKASLLFHELQSNSI